MAPRNRLVMTLLALAVCSNSQASSINRRDADSVTIDFLTRHTEAPEGSDLELRCVVALESEDTPHRVEWIFVPAEQPEGREEEGGGGRQRSQRRTYESDVVGSKNGANEDAGVLALAADGEILLSDNSRFFDGGKRLGVSVRRRWDAVEDDNLEEHFLRIKKLELADQGFFVCQVKKSRQSSSPLAYRHCLVSVTPFHLQTERIPTDMVSSRRRSRNNGADPTHASPLTKSSRNVDEDAPTLGPVTERFMVATRGQDVVLECRDADDNWVYWRKQGDPELKGEGKHLRLFRVDRWDSGVYYCSTNTSLTSVHNITLSVNQPPKATSVLGSEVSQAEGHQAILSCQVEGLPVPQIYWYHVVPSSFSSSSSDPLPHPTQSAVLESPSSSSSSVMPSVLKKAVHSGPDYEISIGAYKDGLITSSVKVLSVSERLYGTYRCEAKNKLGEDLAEVKLERSRKVVDFVELLKRANGDSKDNDNNNSNKRAGDFSSSAESVGYQRISKGLMLAMGFLLALALL